MSTLLISGNAEVVVVSAFVPFPLTQVVYDGPGVRRSKVVWGVRIRSSIVSFLVTLNVGLRVPRLTGALVMDAHQVFAVNVGTEILLGGGLVADLNPGDLIELFGLSSVAGGFRLVAGGFTVVVG